MKRFLLGGFCLLALVSCAPADENLEDETMGQATTHPTEPSRRALWHFTGYLGVVRWTNDATGDEQTTVAAAASPFNTSVPYVEDTAHPGAHFAFFFQTFINENRSFDGTYVKFQVDLTYTCTDGSTHLLSWPDRLYAGNPPARTLLPCGNASLSLVQGTVATWNPQF
jgi:hypothetical protein